MILYPLSFSGQTLSFPAVLFCLKSTASHHSPDQAWNSPQPFSAMKARASWAKVTGPRIHFPLFKSKYSYPMVTKDLVGVRFWDLKLQGADTAYKGKQALFEQGHFGSPSSRGQKKKKKSMDRKAGNKRR